MQMFKGWLNYRRKKSPYAAAIFLTLAGFLVIGVACKLVWPGSLGKHLLTTTVSASTEALSFVMNADQEQSWGLPPGVLSLIAPVESPDCEFNGLESRCALAESTLMRVAGIAKIEFQAKPSGGWRLSVSSVDGQDTDVRLFDQHENELAYSPQLLQFEVTEAATPVRLPFVASSTVLGANLYRATTLTGSAFDFWQPILRAGDVKMIADNKPGREKYLVLTERLDAGDVVRVGAQENPASPAGENVVWGMVSIAPAIQNDAGAGAMDVIIHTSLQELLVTRFGAPSGHVIKASRWTVRSRWPNAQLTWVAFISVILVSGFVLRLGDSLPKWMQDNNAGDGS